MTSEARNGDNIHCLVRLHNALVGARCSMDHPRMDAHKQTWDALQSVLAAFDRETGRELRVAMQNHISEQSTAGREGGVIMDAKELELIDARDEADRKLRKYRKSNAQ